MPVIEKEDGADGRGVGDTMLDDVPSGPVGGGGVKPGGGGGGGGGGDLLDLGDLLGDSGPPAAAPAAAAAPVGGGGGDLGLLGDLLGGGGAPAPAAAPPVAVAAPGGVAPGDLGLMDIFGGGGGAPAGGAAPVEVLAYEKAGLKISMSCQRNPDGSANITARFFNSCDAPMTNFVFEAAVPKYVRLEMKPATGQMLPPHSNSVTQSMVTMNQSNGEKALLMKLRIGYVLNGTPVQEMGQVGGFPPGY
ncbi:unnamed protein product [Prorocentrum cordatum]|nr:unnamed protein product [Polarella glacialis]CAK0813870.1 unnamed protein product [Polarella glacialis]